jgi:hypothetical protein
LLVEFQNSKCSDSRDKVFSLLSLARACKHNQVVADYSKTVFEVYWDVMSFAGGNNKLSNVVKADIEDIVPVNGLPEAIMTRDNLYDGAYLDARRQLPLDPRFLDGSDTTTGGNERANDTSSICSFLLNTGVIGLGPTNIRQGDPVRRITRNTSMAVVLKRDPSGLLTVIGTAVVLRIAAPRDGGLDWAQLITGQAADFFPEGLCGIFVPKVTFFLDLLTLQRWTRGMDKWKCSISQCDSMEKRPSH